MKRRLLLASAFCLSIFTLIVTVVPSDLSAQTPGDKLKKFQKNGKNPFMKDKGDAKPSVDTDDKKYTQEELAFFEKKIRPVLVDKCYSCHTSETQKGPKGGLIADTRNGLLLGGANGPAVVPKDIKNSLIINALKGNGASLMPPKEKDKLSDDVIADFEKWITMGAPDPRTGKSGTAKAAPIDIEKGKQHWAFQKVKVTEPTTKTAKSPIDNYLADAMKEHKLVPNGEADKRTLIRRVYFDLTGLPPTAEAVDAFVADKSSNALEKVIDKLLATSQFGEKWGRHWLDIARYAESSGKEQNVLYPQAWRYRDYVIDAFNSDKPYDQFIKEQLAGDLMTAKDDTDKAKKIIATGFLAIGPKSHNERNPRQFQMDMADEQIDVFSQSMMGITISCARCHDHKFDPIPTNDYYAIAGIFTSTDTKFGTARAIQNNQAAPLVELPVGANLPIGTTHTKTEVEGLKTSLTTLKKQRDDVIEEQRKNPTPGMVNIRLLGLTSQIAIVEKQLTYYDSEGNPKKMAMGVSDKTLPRDMQVLTRGELNKPGETVPRGFLKVIPAENTRISRSSSGRKELSEWVASKQNPLTARVFANRVWQHLFGQGIVTTPDNYGTTGRAPSHPALLDYLASSFTDNGWSMKKLIKSIMMTDAYQRSSAFSEANNASDPDNVYLWRMSKRRLDAESIRDAMYAISGELDNQPANGSPIQKHDGTAQTLLNGFRQGLGLGPNFNASRSILETSKRSIYIPIVRDNVPESLELFDFAEPSLVSGARDDTSVPSQALYLMNNKDVMKLADKTADKLDKKFSSDTEKINAAFKHVYGREPTATETKATTQFLEKFRNAESRSSRSKSTVDKSAWSALVQALFATAEFRYLD